MDVPIHLRLCHLSMGMIPQIHRQYVPISWSCMIYLSYFVMLAQPPCLDKRRGYQPVNRTPSGFIPHWVSQVSPAIYYWPKKCNSGGDWLYGSIVNRDLIQYIIFLPEQYIIFIWTFGYSDQRALAIDDALCGVHLLDSRSHSAWWSSLLWCAGNGFGIHHGLAARCSVLGYSPWILKGW